MEIKEIRYDDNGKWRSTSYNIRIGYVKKFDPIKKYGYIKQYSDEDVFFHISNSLTKDIRVGNIIGFVKAPSIKYQNKFEATHIDLIENYTAEFKEAKFKFSEIEWKMVMKGNSRLFFDSIDNGYNEKVKLKEEIDNYINTINIDEIIRLYQVKVRSGGRCKPGDDDSAWVYIENVWLPDGYSWCMPEKYKYDIYINNLFPVIRKEVYYERAFSPYDRMLAEYRADKENWAKLEQEAIQTETEIKIKVRQEYDRELHRKILEEYLTTEIKNLIEKTESEVDGWVNAICWGEYDKVVSQANYVK